MRCHPNLSKSVIRGELITPAIPKHLRQPEAQSMASVWIIVASYLNRAPVWFFTKTVWICIAVVGKLLINTPRIIKREPHDFSKFIYQRLTM